MPKQNTSDNSQTKSNNGERRTNPFVRKLTVEMLTNTYVNPGTNRVDPEFGRDFVLEKIRRSIIAPLEGITFEQWIDLTNDAFRWHLDTRHEKELAAEALLDKAANDPEILEALERKLTAIRDSKVSVSNHPVRQTAIAS